MKFNITFGNLWMFLDQISTKNYFEIFKICSCEIEGLLFVAPPYHYAHNPILRLHSPYFPSIWTVFLYKFPSSGFWTFCNCFVQPCGPTDLRNNLVGYLNVLGRRKTSKTFSHSRAGQSMSEIHQKHPRKKYRMFQGKSVVLLLLGRENDPRTTRRAF